MSRDIQGFDWEYAERIVESALEEDVGSGDFTTLWCVAEDAKFECRIVSKEEGVLAGMNVARLVFLRIDEEIDFIDYFEDGDLISTGDVVADVKGSARGILTGERTALNFIQRMSGIASATKRYVDAVKGTGAVILDTRKTAPGLRVLDKYSVRVGGGSNHRLGLYDMILIKDNHIEAAGGIAAAVDGARRHMRDRGKDLKVEVEVKNIAQLREALSACPDRVMLDNMGIVETKEAVRIVNEWRQRSKGKVQIEASGDVTVENVRKMASVGVDFISVGALTHSVSALDMSLQFNSSRY